MRMILFIIALLSLSIFAYAEQYEIKSKYFDIIPNDGFMDSGSYSNPFLIEGENGRKIAEIKPKYYDIDPDDGFMDAGSSFNPYIIDTDD